MHISFVRQACFDGHLTPQQLFALASIGTIARLHHWNHGAVHLHNQRLSRRIALISQLTDSSPTAQGMLPDGFNRNVDAVVLAHSFSGLDKRVLRTEIYYHPLQASRVTAIAHSGALAEWTQFGTTSAQPQQLLLKFQRTERGEPSYFFLMCLILFGYWVRACFNASCCLASAQSASISPPSF